MKKTILLLFFICTHIIIYGQTEDGLKQLKAAEAGDAQAQYDIFENYSYEYNGFPEDKTKAIYWLKKAAENGHVKAQNCLAWYYYPKFGYFGGDKDEFLKWCTKAAYGGDIESMNDLARYYKKKKDIQEAIYWYKMAMDAHYKECGEIDEWTKSYLQDLGVYYNPVDKSTTIISSSDSNSFISQIWTWITELLQKLGINYPSSDNSTSSTSIASSSDSSSSTSQDNSLSSGSSTSQGNSSSSSSSTSQGNSSSSSSSTSQDNSSSSSSSTSQGNSSFPGKKLLYKGTYTIEKGPYAGVFDNDYIVEIEIYDDLLWVEGVAPVGSSGRFDYVKTTSSGIRVYKGINDYYMTVNPTTFDMSSYWNSYNPYTASHEPIIYSMTKGESSFNKNYNNSNNNSYNYSSNYSSNNSTQYSSSSKQGTTTRHKCHYCDGGERIQHEYVSTFGVNGPPVYCSICNRSWSYGTVHVHHKCKYCDGSGYIN